MERILLLTFLALGVAIASNVEPIKVNMDTAAECGKVQNPLFTQEIHLSSSGMTSDYCSVGIYNPSEDKPPGCKYSAICVKLTSSKVNDCKMKVTFTGKMFDGTRDHWNELSCFQAFKVNHEWCVPSQFLVAEISREKIANDGKRDYAFNATVYSKCQSKPLPRIPLHEDNEYKNPDQAEADHHNRIIGVIVGVCLASIFLIILFITYCFYSNKPYSEPKSESKERLPDAGLAAKHKPAPKPVVEPTKFTQSIDIRL